MLFSKAESCSAAALPCPAKMKACMYEIISALSGYYRANNPLLEKYSIIRKGISYLEEDKKQLLSIKEIADMCNVSEIYFRRLFKEYSGMPPARYRVNSKISQAKLMLKCENLTSAEISDILCFSDASYFIRCFKSHTGITPTQYKNQFRR